MRFQTKTVVHKIWSTAKLFSIELLIVLIAFISSLITVVFFIKLIFLDKKNEFDLGVFKSLEPYVNHGTTEVMNFFTFFGSQYFLIPANLLLIIYFFFFKKNTWFAIRIISVAISSLVLMFSLKYFFKRPRPLIPLLKEAQGLSFPSGHAFMSFAFFGLLIYIVYKKTENTALKYFLMTLFFLFTTIVGFSRVYLRVHYASDVFSGFALSLIWLVISLTIIQRLEKRAHIIKLV